MNCKEEKMKIEDLEKMQDNAEEAAAFMQGFASPHRLMILCQLVEGEKSVSQLIDATGIAQTSMSQHLSKLKQEGLVDFRREHRTLYYYIKQKDVMAIMTILYRIYCQTSG